MSRAVLKVLHDFPSDANVDAVLVLNSSPAFAAVQAGRRRSGVAGWPMLEADSVAGPTGWLRLHGASSWWSSSAPGRAPAPGFPLWDELLHWLADRPGRNR